MKALLVDDDVSLTKVFEIHFRNMGFEVSTASNGAEALNLADSSRFDIIMLDLVMPVMDGFEVLGRLRAGGANRNTPVIVLTGFGDLSNVMKAAHLGVSDFIVKPIDQNVLKVKVSNAIGARLKIEDGSPAASRAGN